MPPVVNTPHTPTPRQQQQEAEGDARAAAGADPQLAGATEVIDDGTPGADPAAQPRAPAAAPDGTQRPAPSVRSEYDTKRADIVARFRTSRTTEAEEARDEITDFARSGMPPEFEPPAPVAVEEPEPADQAPAAAPAAPQTVRVKVRGVETDLPLDEVIAKAQIALAADNYLDEAKGKLNEVNTLLRETRDKGPRAAQPDQHQARPNSAQTTETQSPAADGAPADPNTTDDPLTKLIETLQFGDPIEARALLQNTIAAEATKAVSTQLQADRLRDEGARSSKVLADFLGQHADIAADPMARAAVEYKVYELQVADLKALGVDPAQIQTATGAPPTPADIAMAHRWYRANGFAVKSPKDMLETATSDFLAWKGVKTPTPEPTADPATRAAPRVDITVDRTARRQAIPQQPSRTAMPQQGGNTPAAPQARDRSDIVASMAATRGKPRGKVA